MRWLKTFVLRHLVSDVPPEMDLCLDCGKLVCSAGEFRECVRRRERAELIVSISARKAGEEGQTKQVADT
jgi:hypothetical protein